MRIHAVPPMLSFALLIGIAASPVTACQLEQKAASHRTVTAFLTEHVGRPPPFLFHSLSLARLMVQPARRMPSAAAVRASPLVRDGLAYPNSEPPLFKNVGDLLPVGVADDEAGVGFFGRPGRREAAHGRHQAVGPLKGGSAAECATGHARDGAGPSTGACRSRAAALLLDLARLRRFTGSPFLVAIGGRADIPSGRSKCRN